MSMGRNKGLLSRTRTHVKSLTSPFLPRSCPVPCRLASPSHVPCALSPSFPCPLSLFSPVRCLLSSSFPVPCPLSPCFPVQFAAGAASHRARYAGHVVRFLILGLVAEGRMIVVRTAVVSPKYRAHRTKNQRSPVQDPDLSERRYVTDLCNLAHVAGWEPRILHGDACHD